MLVAGAFFFSSVAFRVIYLCLLCIICLSRSLSIMKFYVSLLFPTLVVVIFYVFHVAFSQNPGDSKFQCYVCVEGIDPNCGDPFIKGKTGDYLKSCNTPQERPKNAKFSNLTAVGCRKIDQGVEEKVNVIRECAFSGDPTKNLKRSGNKGVRLYYNQCVENGCNSASLPSCTEIQTILATICSTVLALIIRN